MNKIANKLQNVRKKVANKAKTIAVGIATASAIFTGNAAENTQSNDRDMSNGSNSMISIKKSQIAQTYAGEFKLAVGEDNKVSGVNEDGSEWNKWEKGNASVKETEELDGSKSFEFNSKNSNFVYKGGKFVTNENGQEKELDLREVTNEINQFRADAKVLNTASFMDYYNQSQGR